MGLCAVHVQISYGSDQSYTASVPQCPIHIGLKFRHYETTK